MNILVVDDDPMILRMAHDILRASGHDVSVAEDGEVAWQSIRRGPPDLLLADWLMPRVDGPELIARLRTEAAHREIYIIILSSRTAGDDIADGLEMGAHDYITKPFTARELNARIALADRTQRLARAAGEPLPSLYEFDPPPSQPIELPSASLPVLDRSMLDQLRQLDPGGGGQLLIEIAEIFVNEVPRMIEDLRSAVSDRAPTEVRLAAHSLKGSGQGIGAQRFFSIARQLEDMGREGRLDGAAETLAELEAEYLRVQAALRELKGAA